MVKLRIDREDPVLLEAMRLCGTDDPAVAVRDALKFAIAVRVRQAETRAKCDELNRQREGENSPERRLALIEAAARWTTASLFNSNAYRIASQSATRSLS